MKIDLQDKESPYNSEFVAKVLDGDEDIKAGRTKKISLDDIWKALFQSVKITNSDR